MTGANELIADAPPNLLTPSLPCAGVKPDDLRRQDPGAIVAVQERKMPWTDVWSAGHGVGSIHDVRSLRALCDLSLIHI